MDLVHCAGFLTPTHASSHLYFRDIFHRYIMNDTLQGLVCYSSYLCLHLCCLHEVLVNLARFSFEIRFIFLPFNVISMNKLLSKPSMSWFALFYNYRKGKWPPRRGEKGHQSSMLAFLSLKMNSVPVHFPLWSGCQQWKRTLCGPKVSYWWELREISNHRLIVEPTSE
jgi:hypothetical protein